MKGARHVSGGRRRPRDVLYMAALSATIRNAEMKALCGRLRERGGHRKVALAGVMRSPMRSACRVAERYRKVALAGVMRRPVVTANALPRDRRMREKRMGAARGARKPPAPSPNRLQTGRDVPAGGVNASGRPPACGQGCGQIVENRIQG